MARLAGKVAIVTGAGSGIGHAIATTFAAEGAAVACADLDLAAAERTVEAIETAGGRALALACDVAESAACRNAADACFDSWGRIDILVNNAAFFARKGTVTEIDEAEWDRTLRVNIGGAFLMSRYTIPVMVQSGGGSIIHIASQMGRVGEPREPAYCAAKGALLNLAKAMALDHAAEGIRVNTLSPGGIATPAMAAEWGSLEIAERDWGRARHPLGRLGQPEEIAAAALFLASAESSFMTGADLLVDGGFTAR
jgi:NAD(P)-dependent dehydrogenase (short-subunit alcohol dehydrogenase family)